MLYNAAHPVQTHGRYIVVFIDIQRGREGEREREGGREGETS